jgi:choline dehydrogenase
MGRDAISVVNGRLQIYGVDGLRIADASIMPRVRTGNTMGPCVVIGEQAAAFFKPQPGKVTGFSCPCRLLTFSHD